MSVEVAKDASGHTTTHTLSATHALSVEHQRDPHPSAPSTHAVILHNGDSVGSVRWPTIQHGADHAWVFTGHSGHYGPPPSERLRALIEAHGEDHAWMPLLDAVAEEYPDLEPAVAAHTAARA